jgi:hypothetical protein
MQADDRKCDSAPGANDGICDACPLAGGVTTADEMFIPLGNYYCDPSVPGETARRHVRRRSGLGKALRRRPQHRRLRG